MGRKTIWMNPPLQKIADAVDSEGAGKKQGRGGGFSPRLGDIVGRYDVIMRMTPAPDLTEAEIEILSEVLAGSAIVSGSEYDTPAITVLKFMHMSILDCASGTEADRKALSKKAEKWTAAEKIAIVESLGL